MLKFVLIRKAITFAKEFDYVVVFLIKVGLNLDMIVSYRILIYHTTTSKNISPI